MGLIIPPGYLQAAYQFSLYQDPDPIIVTCGHEIDGASGATGEDAADDLFTSFAAEVVSVMMSNQYTLEAVITYVGNDGPPFVYVSTESPVTGPSAATVVPQNTAYLIRKRTDLAGRRGRGRMYVPGVRESEVNASGVVNGSHVTAWDNAFQDWYDFLTAGVGARLYPPVILHREEGAGTEPPPTPIATFRCDDQVATQRRRLRH